MGNTELSYSSCNIFFILYINFSRTLKNAMLIHATVSAACYLQFMIWNRTNNLSDFKKSHSTGDENIFLLRFNYRH
jgi:hypothetical protein